MTIRRGVSSQISGRRERRDVAGHRYGDGRRECGGPRWRADIRAVDSRRTPTRCADRASCPRRTRTRAAVARADRRSHCRRRTWRLYGAAHAAGVESVAVCYDALRGQVYGAIYAFDGDEVKTLVAPDLFTIPTLAVRARKPPDLVVGDGAERYGETVVAWTGRAPVGIAALPPIAGSLLALFSYDGARRAIEDPRVVEPVYGRPAEAQVKWETRHGRPLPHSSR